MERIFPCIPQQLQEGFKPVSSYYPCSKACGCYANMPYVITLILKNT